MKIAAYAAAGRQDDRNTNASAFPDVCVVVPPCVRGTYSVTGMTPGEYRSVGKA